MSRAARGRSLGSEGSPTSPSTSATTSSRDVIPMPTVQPFNQADASLLPSALHSPTQSYVEIDFHTVAFSRNASFVGGSTTSNGLPAPTAAAASGDGGQTMPADEGGAEAGVVKVDVMPAIIGYFGNSFGNGICAFYSQVFSAKAFPAYQIGILVAVNPLLSMTLLPVLSYTADKYRCETKMVITSVVIASVAMIGYTASQPRALVVVFFLVMTAARIIINPLLDQRILMMFPRHGRSSAWSYVRSYAAYGWGIGCFTASLLASATGSWVAAAGQYAVGQIGLIYCMLTTKPYEKIEKVPVRFKEVLHLLASNKRVSLFLFAATMMGTGYSFIDNFLFLFLKDLDGSKALMGFTVVLTVSTEIPLFQMSERLHQMFTERHMMAIAMSVWTFRVICYSLLTNPWYVLLIEPLHGVTFAFMWLPSVHLIARAFPPKLSSSATGVLFTFTSGVGPMMGNLIAGTLYSLIGPRKMFLCAATAMGLALVFYLCMDVLLERRGVPIVCDFDAPVVTAAADVTVTEEGDNSDPGKGDEGAAGKERHRRCHRLQQAKEGIDGGRQAALDVRELDLPF